MTKFRMFGIHLDQFAILSKENLTDDLGMNVSLNFKYADNGKKIACPVEFEFRSEQEKLMVLGITCEFEIQEDDWQKLKKDGNIVVPKDLLEFFAMHTIGTARGVLFCKTESTPFNNIIIPPLNVSKIVTKDLVIGL